MSFDLAGALSSAAPGSVVTVPAGDYAASTTDSYPWKIPAGITLQGAGSGLTILHGGVSMWQPGATLRGVRVTGATQDGIDCQADSCLIDRCYVTGCFQGIGAWEGSTGLVIQNCLLAGNGAGGRGHNIYLQNPAGKTKTVRRCLLVKGASNYSLHAYGESAHVSDLLVQDCTFLGGNNLIGGWLPGGGYRVSDCTFYNADLLIGWSGQNEDVVIEGCQWYGTGGISTRLTRHVTIQQCIAGEFGVAFQGVSDPILDGSGNTWPYGGNVFSFPDGWQIGAAVADHNTNPPPTLLKASYGNRLFIDQDPRYRGWGPGPKLAYPDTPGWLTVLAEALLS